MKQAYSVQPGQTVRFVVNGGKVGEAVKVLTVSAYACQGEFVTGPHKGKPCEFRQWDMIAD